VARDDAPARLRKGVDGQVRGLDWVVPAVLESVTVENGEPRGVVRELGDDRDPIDGIPIWTPYAAGDEYGHEQALRPPERGLMICPDYPLEVVRQETEPPKNADLERGRHHAFRDGFFLPGVRRYGDRGLGSDLEEDIWRPHEPPSGTERQITPDSAVHWRANNEASDLQDGEGPNAPDRTRVSLLLDGTIPLAGRVRLGQPGAPRWDPDKLAGGQIPDGDELRDVEVDEPTEPIIDPTDDAETQYVNAPVGEANGPIDGGLYEARRLIPWERREVDPDPSVTNPDDPAYIEIPDDMRAAGELPTMIPWANVNEGVVKWWRDGAKEVLFP